MNVCVCLCMHPGPQDHSVAIVTSTIRAQEAKAQDLRESDGVRLRNEMSYGDTMISVGLSVMHWGTLKQRHYTL